MPAAGISGVVVAPDARGRRLAEEIVGSILRELQSSFALSSLYPATVPIYRRLGYEYAAARTQYSVKVDDLVRLDGAGPAEPWDDDSLEEVAAAQRFYASGYNGPIDRPQEWWTGRVLAPIGEQSVYRYLVRENGRVTGATVYTLEGDWHYTVEARDFWWSTPYAVRTLLSFFARHASMGQKITWFGPSVDPAALLLPEDVLRKNGNDFIQYPMYRVLNVEQAIGLRGYAETPPVSITVAIDDPLLPANLGPWHIRAEGGKGSAERADDAEAVVPVGVFSAMYTGFLAPSEARRAGLLDASDDMVARLERLFSGPIPWLGDFF